MSFLDRLLGRPPRGGSGAVARERLKLILECDRARLSAAELEKIRDEIIETISRHISFDSDDVEITLGRDGRLIAEIPLDKSERHPAQP